jgi:hypothetical protein
MIRLTTEASQRKTAKIAGIFYLFLITFGIIAQVIRSNLIVWNAWKWPKLEG